MSLDILFKHYVAQGDRDLAYTLYPQILKEHPKDLELLFQSAVLLVDLQRFDEAWRTLNARITPLGDRPEFAALLELLKLKTAKIERPADALLCARTLAQTAFHQETIAAYELAHRLDTTNASIARELGHFLSEMTRRELDAGQDLAALRHVQALIQIDPQSADAWHMCARAQRNLGDLEAAYASIEQSLALDDQRCETWLDKTALEICRAESPEQAAACISSAHTTLGLFVRQQYSMGQTESPMSKLKHDHEQACYLKQEVQVDWADDFIQVSGDLLHRLQAQPECHEIQLTEVEIATFRNYQQKLHLPDLPDRDTPCLNPQLDWDAVCSRYFSASPNLVVIDNFLTPEALSDLRRFCHEAKVWHTSYQFAYLGAFADRGFISPTHLKIARELKLKLARILDQQRLEQLWAFKYDSVLGRGINVHADFARVNLNFWITPDEYHLNKGRGGMVVFSEPAPKSWRFHDYNVNAQKIYDHLNQNHARGIGVPYQCNRAVLFDSALFHETDEIHFADHYQGRRINMTYLFGAQLKDF
jgi:tetratricopeptide (TPR) repeat protein